MPEIHRSCFSTVITLPYVSNYHSQQNTKKYTVNHKNVTFYF